MSKENQRGLRKPSICKKCSDLYVHTDGMWTCTKDEKTNLLRLTQKRWATYEPPKQCKYKLEQTVIEDEKPCTM